MFSTFGRFALPVAWTAALFGLSKAATVTYDFNIAWLTSNPDGAFDRPTIGINGQWPIPPIVGNVGDNIVVQVTNQLGNQSTSLHFHGLFMNGTTHMDGPSQVSQCSIAPGSSFTYNFTVRTLYFHYVHQRGRRIINKLKSSTNLAHIGTTPIPMDNTLTGSEDPSSSTTPTLRFLTHTTSKKTRSS